MKHYSVLQKECLSLLDIKDDGIYVDATLGYAGDSKEILKRLKSGLLIAIDRDEAALSYSRNVLDEIGSNYVLFHDRFSNLKKCLESIGIQKVDGILFDLGVSSPQLDENRGFSFMRDEVLDMRMNQKDLKSAKEVVNLYAFEDLKRIFFQYGEEPKSAFIAKEIVLYREQKEICTTKELVDLILKAVGANYFYKNHPERNIFQAIRMEVNEELKEIETALKEAISVLKSGGKLVVITFHSLEDRLVKQIFKQYSEIDPLVKGLPEIPIQYLPKIKWVQKKPIVPSEQELKENSRSKSAKLRVVERI